MSTPSEKNEVGPGPKIAGILLMVLIGLPTIVLICLMLVYLILVVTRAAIGVLS